MPAEKQLRVLCRTAQQRVTLSKTPLAFVAQPRAGELVAVDCNQLLFNATVDARLGLAERGVRDEQRRLGEPVDQSVKLAPSCFVAFHVARAVAMCGFWDNSFKVFAADSGRLLQSCFEHGDVVTALCVSSDNTILVSGSQDAVMYVWDVRSAAGGLELQRRAMLVGHEHTIACVAVDKGQDMVVSGSHGLLLIHTLAGDLLHAVTPPLLKPHSLAVSPNGSCVAFFRDRAAPTLMLLHMNGRVLSTVAAGEHVTAMLVSRNGDFVVTGGFGQRVYVRRATDLQLVCEYAPCGAAVRSLCFAGNESAIVAALSSGELVTFEADAAAWQQCTPIAPSPPAEMQPTTLASP